MRFVLQNQAIRDIWLHSQLTPPKMDEVVCFLPVLLCHGQIKTPYTSMINVIKNLLKSLREQSKGSNLLHPLSLYYSSHNLVIHGLSAANSLVSSVRRRLLITGRRARPEAPH